MSSYAARIQAIGDAILNKTATQAQLDHLGRALASAVSMDAEYAAMTQGEKATFAVERVRTILVGLVKRYDALTASADAASSATAAVDTEFATAP
jgi:hypothetical protein